MDDASGIDPNRLVVEFAFGSVERYGRHVGRWLRRPSVRALIQSVTLAGRNGLVSRVEFSLTLTNTHADTSYRLEGLALSLSRRWGHWVGLRCTAFSAGDFVKGVDLLPLEGIEAKVRFDVETEPFDPKVPHKTKLSLALRGWRRPAVARPEIDWSQFPVVDESLATPSGASPVVADGPLPDATPKYTKRRSDPMTPRSVAAELSYADFETFDGRIGAECLHLLQQQGVGSMDEVRDLFGDAETRGELKETHDEAIKGTHYETPIFDAKIFCRWGPRYFKDKTVDGRARVLAEFREWARLNAMRYGFREEIDRKLRLLRDQIAETAVSDRTPDKFGWRVGQLSAWQQNSLGFCSRHGLSDVLSGPALASVDRSSLSDWNALLADIERRAASLAAVVAEPPFAEAPAVASATAPPKPQPPTTSTARTPRLSSRWQRKRDGEIARALAPAIHDWADVQDMKPALMTNEFQMGADFTLQFGGQLSALAPYLSATAYPDASLAAHGGIALEMDPDRARAVAADLYALAMELTGTIG